MKPECLKGCATCGKIKSDHSFREIHSHYSFYDLMKFLSERENILNKEAFAKIRHVAIMAESQKTFEKFIENYMMFRGPVFIYDDVSFSMEQIGPKENTK